jgi:putative SOS response-associated peptidase YedK
MCGTARPPDVRDIHMREVSTLVNNVRNNGTELLEPIDPQAEQARLL